MSYFFLEKKNLTNFNANNVLQRGGNPHFRHKSMNSDVLNIRTHCLIIHKFSSKHKNSLDILFNV